MRDGGGAAAVGGVSGGVPGGRRNAVHDKHPQKHRQMLNFALTLPLVGCKLEEHRLSAIFSVSIPLSLMKLHLPMPLRSAVFACFSAACALTTTLFSGSLAAYLLASSQSYAAYNAATTTFEGTNNGGINPMANTYSGVETLIFNMGTAGTGNYFNQASWTYGGNIQIGAAGATGTGLCLNNGHSNQTDVFSGKVTGTGLLSKTGAGNGLAVAFTGDVSDFSGAIRLGSTAAFTLRFGDGSSAVSGATVEHGVSGTGDITFSGTTHDTLVYHYVSDSPVYITNRLLTADGATSKVQLNGAAPYVLTKDAAVSQLTLDAGTSLHIGAEGKRAEVVLGALTMGAGASVHVDNGVLALPNASSLDGSFSVGAQGVLHLLHTAALNGALAVESGGAVSLGSLSDFNVVEGGTSTPAAGTNGFAVVNGKLSVFTGADEQLQALAGTKVLYEQQQFELAADGTVTLSEVDRSVYYLRNGAATLSSLAAESNHLLNRVEMSAGAELTVDAGAVQGRFRFGSPRVISAAGLATTMTGLTHVENLAATQELIIGNGATLSIGSTTETNVSNINICANGHLEFEADQPTRMRIGAINNKSDSSDNFARTILVGEGVSLRAASLTNAWGLKSLTVNGELNIDGVLQYSTGRNADGTNLLTGTGAITAGSLNISNNSTSNTIDVHTLTVTGNAAISRSTTISGGTTSLLGNTTVSAALNLTGGKLILGDAAADTARLNQTLTVSGGQLSLHGTTTLSGTLNQTGGSVVNNGTLTVSGALALSSVMENSTGTITFNSGAGLSLADAAAFEQTDTYSDGENGFYLSTSALVFRGGSISGAENVSVTVGGESSALADDGTVLLSNAADYSTYHLNSGSKNLSEMLSASGGALRTVRTAVGTTLVADTGAVQGIVSAETPHDFSVGSEGLDRISYADVRFEQLSSTADLVAYVGTTMTIGSTEENNAGNIFVTQGAHLIFESEHPAAMSVGNIYFQGACDDFERTMLVGEGVTLHAASVVNSWGVKSLTVNGALNIDGMLQYATSSNTEGTNLITGSGTITAGSLQVSNWSYFNTFDVLSLHVLGEANFGCHTSITGGTVTIDGRLTKAPRYLEYGSPVLTIDGGHLISNGTAFMISETVLSSGAITFNGSTTIAGQYRQTGGTLTVNGNLNLNNSEMLNGSMALSGGEFVLNGEVGLDSRYVQTGGTLSVNGTLSLLGTLTASGTVNLNGTLQSSSGALSSTVSYTDGENGFMQRISVLLNKGEGDLNFNLGENARFLFNGEDCTSSLTSDASGNIVIRSVNDSYYYLNSGSKRLSDIINGTWYNIVMAAGTTVEADTGYMKGLFHASSLQYLNVGPDGLTPYVRGDVHIEQMSVTSSADVSIADNSTLHIGSTAADNAGGVFVGSNAHLNFEAAAPREMHVGTIGFSYGGGCDNSERTVLVGEDVTLHAASFLNYWGMKSLTVDGTLNIDGSLYLSTNENYESPNLVTGDGSISVGSLEVRDSSSNTINVRELQVAGNAFIYSPLTISGGTTCLSGNTTVSSDLNITGGHLVLGDERSDAAELNGNMNLSAGELTLNGTGTLGNNIHQTGGILSINGEYSLLKTLSASGTVNLNGTLKSTASVLTTTGSVYPEGENGFRRISYTVINKGEGDLQFNLGENGHYLLGNEDCTDLLTTDASGNLVLLYAVRDVYYLNIGSASLSDIQSEAGRASFSVEMAEGSTLDLNAGSVRGQFCSTAGGRLSISSGALSSSIGVDGHFEQLSATKQINIAQDVTLSIGSTTASNTGSLCIYGGGTLAFEAAEPTEMHIGSITTATTRGGQGSRTVLVGEGVTLHASELSDSWGLSTLAVDGELMIRGCLEYSSSSESRLTGAGSVTAGSLSINKAGDYEIDVRSLTVTGNASIKSSTILSGGSVALLGTTTASGNLHIAGGQLILGDERSDTATLSNTVALSGGELIINGTASMGSNLQQTGGSLTVNGELNLLSTPLAGGHVTLNGTLLGSYNALSITDAVSYSDGENGYRTADYVLFSKGEGEIDFCLGDNARILLDGVEETAALRSDAAGNVVVRHEALDVYYLRNGSVHLPDISSVSGGALTTVSMEDGTNLDTGDGLNRVSVSTPAHLSVSNGEMVGLTQGEARIEQLSQSGAFMIGGDATLTVSSTAADNAGDIGINAGGRLVFDAGTPAQMSVGTITAGSDSVASDGRSILVCEGTSLRAAALDNTHGMQSLTVNGEMQIDDELRIATGGRRLSSPCYLTGDGSLTVGSLSISGSYADTEIDVQNLLVTGDTAISKVTTISGGTTVFAGNTSLRSTLYLADGHLILGDDCSDVISLSGDYIRQTGGELTINGDMTISSVMTASGSVTLNGIMRGNTAQLSKVSTDTYSEGNNGFRHADYILYKNSGDLLFRLGEQASVIMNGDDDTAHLSTDAAGNILVHHESHEQYYLREGSKALSDLQSIAGSTLTSVEMAGGTTLVADTGKIQGAFHMDDAYTFEVFPRSSSVSLSVDTQVEQLSSTIGLSLQTGVTLLIGSTAADNSGNITVARDAQLTFASSEPSDMSIGSLTIGGKNAGVLIADGVSLHTTSLNNSYADVSLQINGELYVAGNMSIDNGTANSLEGSGKVMAGNFSAGSYISTTDISVESLHVAGNAFFDGVNNIIGTDVTVMGNTRVRGSLNIDGHFITNGITQVDGSVTLSSGELQFNGITSLENLTQMDGVSSLNGSGSVDGQLELAAGSLTINSSMNLYGNICQTGGTMNLDGTLTYQGGSITSSGTLNLNGTLQSSSRYLTTVTDYSDGDNGFLRETSKLIQKGDGELNFTLGERGVILVDGKDVTADLSRDEFGNVILRKEYRDTYLINSGSVALSDVQRAGATELRLEGGATLVADNGSWQGLVSAVRGMNLVLNEGGLSSTLTEDVHVEQLAVEHELSLGKGVSLNVGSTAAGNTGDMAIGEGAHLAFSASEPTEMRVGRILTTDAGVTDSRTLSVDEGVTLHAAAAEFSRNVSSVTVNGHLDIDGALDYKAGLCRPPASGSIIVTLANGRSAPNVLTGSGTVTAGSLSLGTYGAPQVIDVHEFTVTGNAEIGRETAISGGTTSLMGNTAVSGELNVSGGHLVLGNELSDSIELSGSITLSAGEMTINGSAVTGSRLHQTGGVLTINGALTLEDVLTASGTVCLNGTLQSSSSALVSSGYTVYNEGGSGRDVASYTLFRKGETDLNFVLGDHAVVMLDGVDVTAHLATDDGGNIVLRSVSDGYELHGIGDVEGKICEISHAENSHYYHSHTQVRGYIESPSSGLTVYHGASLNLLDNDSLVFSNAYAGNGGTIMNCETMASVTIDSNRAISFSANEATENGGAIWSRNQLEMLRNEKIVFLRNEAGKDGGALWNDSLCSINNNGDVFFRQNRAGELGGAIWNSGTVLMDHNDRVSFIDNSAAFCGGAIYNTARGSISLDQNGIVEFIGQSLDSVNYYLSGGAIFNSGGITMNDNGSVSFRDNTLYGYVSWGAIKLFGACINNETFASFSMNGNASVEFCNNIEYEDYNPDSSYVEAYTWATAILNREIFSMDHNGSIVFSGNIGANTLDNFGNRDYGYNHFSMCHNGEIRFIHNESTALRNYYFGNFDLNDNKLVEFRDNDGCAILNIDYVSFNMNRNEQISISGCTRTAITNGYTLSSFTMEDNQLISFSGNTDGAINNANMFEMNRNRRIVFSDNRSGDRTDAILHSMSGGYLYNMSNAGSGAAIHNEHGDFTIRGSEEVSFLNNSAFFDGGAIANYTEVYNGTFTLADNGTVSFIGNSAGGNGGAIKNSRIFVVNGNEAVTFRGNTATNGGAIINDYRRNEYSFAFSDNGVLDFSGNMATAAGGAIYNSGKEFALTANGDIRFCNNTSGTSGGAIYNGGSLEIRNNGSMLFRENIATQAEGSALFNDKKGSLVMSGNGDVLFERNAEILDGVYRLRSIYSNGVFELSAKDGKNITFRDSIFAAGSVRLNAEGTGNIILTGATTAADLLAVKGEEGTAVELARSFTSRFNTDVALLGGSLQVREGANALFNSLSVGAEQHTASLNIGNGWVDTALGTTLSAGSALELSGANVLLSSELFAEGNNVLNIAPGEENLAHAALSVSGALAHDENMSIHLGDVSALTGHNYHILHLMGQTDGWREVSVQLAGASADALTWVGDDLYLFADEELSIPQDKGDLGFDEHLTTTGRELMEGYHRLSFDGLNAGITNADYAVIMDNDEVCFRNHPGNLRSDVVIVNNGVFTLSGNDTVSFTDHVVKSGDGTAIYNNTAATFSLSGNCAVAFTGNSTGGNGGAIFNRSVFSLTGNGEVCFTDNSGSFGGAIRNEGHFVFSQNAAVRFTANSANDGAAIYNNDIFEIRENGEVVFSCNVSKNGGNALYNTAAATFTMSGNGNVLFEKNAETSGDVYRLRSIYSLGTLELSAAADKSITFRDTLYVAGTVKLNAAGTGAIVITGASAAEDLLALKGTEGTVDELERSYNSYFDTETPLLGGSLQVQDGARVLFRNLSVGAEAQTASLGLQDGWVDVSGQLSMSAGSSMNFAGRNVLLANDLLSEGNNTLSFAVGEENAEYAVLSVAANLGNAHNLSINLGNVSELTGQNYHVLHVMGNSEDWESVNVQLSGASPDALSWVGNDLYLFADASLLHSGKEKNLTVTEKVSANSFARYDDYKHLSFEGSTSGVSNSEYLVIMGNDDVSFLDCAQAVNNLNVLTVSGNASLSFIGNGAGTIGGAIENRQTLSMCNNGSVIFSDNRATTSGAAIENLSLMELSNNDRVIFSGNSVAISYNSTLGGAIYNDSRAVLSMNHNGLLSFVDNSCGAGGAIFNGSDSVINIIGNEQVLFSGNHVGMLAGSWAGMSGGAIVNNGVLNVSGNGSVIFEKNVEQDAGSFMLRGLRSIGTLNLSAPEGKSIIFREAISTSGTVQLNQDGKGDIIFTGATTEQDIREMKGTDGTEQEIANSRTSTFERGLKLYGGRLVVEDGAVLSSGSGLVVAEGANATVCLNNGTLSLNSAQISSGSGLELLGNSSVRCSYMTMESGTFINLKLNDSAVQWSGSLTLLGDLAIHIDVEDSVLQKSYELISGLNNLRGWNDNLLSAGGVSKEHLVRAGSSLYYRPLMYHQNGYYVLDANVRALSDALAASESDVVELRGNGHTLIMQDDMQLAQLALREAALRLEGSENIADSVSLSEDATLVLAEGAGLKVSDMIRLAAFSEGEFGLSGNVTLDNKGLAGKEGEMATLDHADARVLGDAGISNLRVEDSLIDLAEACTVNFSHVVLAATARLTDEPATANLDDVTAELMMGVNTAKVAAGVLPAGAVLVQNGNTAQTLSPDAESTVVQLESTTFDSLTLAGSSLVLELRGLEADLYHGEDYIALSFTSGKSYATFEDGLVVLLSADGEHYAQGYYLQGGDHSTLYFAGHEAGMAAPEPATATLSLLALAALAARRKRK